MLSNMNIQRIWMNVKKMISELSGPTKRLTTNEIILVMLVDLNKRIEALENQETQRQRGRLRGYPGGD